MASLIFIASFITVFILLIRLIIQLIKHKSIVATLRLIVIILFGYVFLWIIFYFKGTLIAVPFGTDICFDDWCATITQAETPKDFRNETRIIPHGQFIVCILKCQIMQEG